MKIINDFLKKRVINTYIYKMTPKLVKNYGPLDQFTVPQIERVAKECKLSMRYIPYAIALYRHEESNRTKNLYRIDQWFLDILKKEISMWFFEGYKYKTRDVIKLSKPRVWRGGRMSKSTY